MKACLHSKQKLSRSVFSLSSPGKQHGKGTVNLFPSKCSSFQDLVPLKSEAQESEMEVPNDASAVQIEHDTLQEVVVWCVYCVLLNDV